MTSQQIEVSIIELIVGILVGIGAGLFFWLILHILILGLIFIVGSFLVPIGLYCLGLLDIQ
jgi:hypothetical protein